MVLATITAGMAKMMRKDVTSIDQTNTGMRSSVMPGARCLNVVTMISTATASADTSVKVIICAHTSARFPGEYSGPESGTYANQPMSGPIFSMNEIQRKDPPNRNTQ